MLLKKKRSLLNSHILHLTFSLVGTVDSGHETSIIPNSTAFQDLLCDFEVRAWEEMKQLFVYFKIEKSFWKLQLGEKEE